MELMAYEYLKAEVDYRGERARRTFRAGTALRDQLTGRRARPARQAR